MRYFHRNQQKNLHNHYVNKFMNSSFFVMEENYKHYINFCKSITKRSMKSNGITLKCFRIQKMSDFQLRKFYVFNVSKLFDTFENFEKIYESYLHSNFYLIIDGKKQLTNNGYFFVRPQQDRSFYLYLNILFNGDKSYTVIT